MDIEFNSWLNTAELLALELEVESLVGRTVTTAMALCRYDTGLVVTDMP